MHVTNQVTRNYATLGLSIYLSRHCYFSLRDYRFDRLQTLYYIRYYAMSYVFTKQSKSFLDEFIIARYTINFRSTCDRLYMVAVMRGKTSQMYLLLYSYLYNFLLYSLVKDHRLSFARVLLYSILLYYESLFYLLMLTFLIIPTSRILFLQHRRISDIYWAFRYYSSLLLLV